ncbi:hypothetical protein [Microcystis aeruginosa]|nr:hypothetical protein [Microcystis aeruginosa]
MGKWGSGEVGRINKNNLLTTDSCFLSPVSCLLSPVSCLLTPDCLLSPDG